MTFRYLIDTNILLNACFIPSSTARLCIDQLKSEGCIVYVTSRTLQESERTLEKFKIELGLSFDPQEFLDRFKVSMNLFITDIPAIDFLDGVNRADQHIAHAARSINAVVITDDLPLYVQLDDAAVDVITSYMKIGAEPKNLAVGGDHPETSGQKQVLSAFARISGLSESNRDSTEQRYIFDITGFGGAYFAPGRSKWKFTSDSGPTKSRKYQPAERDKYTVAITMTPPLKRQTLRSDLTFLLGRHDTGKSIFREPLGKVLRQEVKPRRVYVGSSRRAESQLGGHIEAIFFGRFDLGRNKWKALLRKPELWPEDLSADALKTALRTIDKRFHG